MRKIQEYLKHKKIIAALIVGVLGITTIVYASPGHDGDAEPAESNATATPAVGVETVTDSNTISLGATSLSWTGEVLSTADVQVYGSREGQIAEWKVRLGDTVKKGQVLGKLTPPPASPELSSLLAQQTQSLVRARAQAAATEKLVRDAKSQLALLQTALNRSRDTALAVVEKEAEKDIQNSLGAGRELTAIEATRQAAITSAKAELQEAEELVPLKLKAARASVVRLSQQTAGKIVLYGQVPTSPQQIISMPMDYAYGSYDSTVRDQFRIALQRLMNELADPGALPESAATAYVDATLKLLSASSANDRVSSEQISEARETIIDDQAEMLGALREYKQAEANLSVKQATLAKITADTDREVIQAETNVKNAKTTIDSVESFKQNKIAEADTEFVRQKAELMNKVAELDRELALAYAEANGAAAAYSIVAVGAAGQNIVAPQAGVVSALFKNVGDHVTPDTAIGGISSPNSKTRFVRFRIPSDMRLPEVGEEVGIERPGFPLTPVKAKVIGVGLALDQNGSYAADAEFSELTEWPVHTSVRVIGKQLGGVVLAPLTAIWWNEKGEAQVWLVMENNVIRPQAVKVGRAIGDRIEIENGLAVGDRFVSKAHSDLKTGQSVTDLAAKTAAEAAAAPKPAGDGHDHEH